MDRRLFVRQSALGFTIPFLPSSFFNESLPDNQSVNLVVSELAELIQNDELGTLQRISVSHIYSPARTKWSTLLSTTSQDFALLSELLGDALPSDLSTHLSNAKPDAFGSFSTRITYQETSIIWQALAHVKKASGTPSRTIILAGSKGVVQLNLSKPGFKLVDFQGKTVAKNSSTKAGSLLI
ncbi:hypothetical protein GCM10028807_10320 [Spirosoma daeguense]